MNSPKVENTLTLPIWGWELESLLNSDRLVLLIEPEEDLRLVTQTCLELTTNWRILTTASHQDGFLMMEKLRPDVLIVNGELEKWERSPLYNYLRANSLYQDIPVICIADRLRLGDHEYCASLGFAGAISKPFDSATLGQQIVCLLQRFLFQKNTIFPAIDD